MATNPEGHKVMRDSSKEAWLFLLIPIALIAAVISFFATGGGPVLKQQGGGFWIWVVGGTIVAIVLAILAYREEKNAGKNIKTWLFVVFGVILLISPWGKACTDKANKPISMQSETIQVK